MDDFEKNGTLFLSYARFVQPRNPEGKNLWRAGTTPILKKRGKLFYLQFSFFAYS